MQFPRIAVFPSEDFPHHERLLLALGELFGVRFIPGRQLDPRFYDAAILFGASRAEALQCARYGLRCLAFVRSQLRAARPFSSEVCFADTPYLSPCFRGMRLPDTCVEMLCDIGHDSADEVIAQQGENVLWIHRPEGTSAVDLLAARPPILSGSDYLFSHFQERNWFSLFPLLHFVREVSTWTFPPMRACFMFDDPNLHWKSYGYVRYKEMAEDATAHNYHVSFATIPMDGWYVHQPTARLFRENSDRLSLLVHGNDHS